MVIMSALENNILKELDRHLLKANVISTIMKQLTNTNIKNKFLNYLIEHRNVVLDKFEVITFIRNELSSELY